MEAFGLLYERFSPAIYDFLARMTRDTVSAEDLTQLAFTRAWERHTQVREPERVRAWLFSTAHHVALDHLRRRRSEEPVDDQSALASTEPGPQETAEIRDAAALVWAAASSLEPRQYAVLDLTVRQGFSTPEVAQALKTSTGHAAVLVHRAREALGNAVRYLLVARRRDRCELLAALVPAGVSALSAAQRTSVDHHMRRCNPCRALADRLTQPAELLGTLPLLTPPPRLHTEMRDRVLTGARADRSKSTNPPRTPLRRRPLGIGWRVALVVLLVLVLGGVGGVVALRHRDQRPGTANAVAPAISPPSATPAVTAHPSATPSPPALWTYVGGAPDLGDWTTATRLSDGRVLLVGGCSISGSRLTPLATTAMYDPATTNVMSVAAPHTAHGTHIAVALADGRVLIVGGAADAKEPLAEVYDPATNTWATTGPTAALISYGAAGDRQSAGSFLLMGAARDGTGGDGPLVACNGGSAGNPVLPSMTLLPTGKVLLAGATVALFDPQSNAWIRGPSLHIPRTGHTATLLEDGTVLVVGGAQAPPQRQTTNEQVNVTEIYSPTTNRWTVAAQLPGSFGAGGQSLAARLSDGRVLITGTGVLPPVGSQGRPIDLTYVYEPRIDQWSPAPPVEGFSFGGHGITLLPDRHFLVVGSPSAVCDERSFTCVRGVRPGADDILTFASLSNSRVLVVTRQASNGRARLYSLDPSAIGAP